jgi:MFS family permease
MAYGKPVDYGKIMGMIIAFVGAILFLVSIFLPLISGGGVSYNLIDIYSVLADSFQGISLAPTVPIGYLITAIFAPITLAIGFLSIVRSRLTRLAGILGIVSSAGLIMAVAGWRSYLGPSYGPNYGFGIWVGLAGAIILLISSYISKMISAAAPVSAGPPPPLAPPPSPQAVQTCPTCGGPLTFIEQYNRWYCYKCQKYI